MGNKNKTIKLHECTHATCGTSSLLQHTTSHGTLHTTSFLCTSGYIPPKKRFLGKRGAVQLDDGVCGGGIWCVVLLAVVSKPKNCQK